MLTDCNAGQKVNLVSRGKWSKLHFYSPLPPSLATAITHWVRERGGGRERIREEVIGKREMAEGVMVKMWFVEKHRERF